MNSLTGNLWRALLIVLYGIHIAHAQSNSDADMTRRRPTTESTPPGSFQIPAPSVLCEHLSRCGSNSASATSPKHHYLSHQQPVSARNCFCDNLCNLYDDCCHDFRSEETPSLTNQTTTLRAYVSCQRVADSESGSNSSEVYVVTRCPADYDDVYVRERCERPPTTMGAAAAATGADDRFYRLPVRGGAPLYLLYRNVYCAVCFGDRELIFWRASLRCGGIPPSPIGHPNGSSLLRSLSQSAPSCPTVFLPSRESMSLPAARVCKINIGRCDRSWTDRAVTRKCREITNYVYAGNRAFRNRNCAICNYVNETYLRCEDNRLPAMEADGNYKIVLEEYVPFLADLDFNRRRAVISVKQDGGTRHSRPSEEVVTFQSCPDGKIYDPFTDQCRLISCRHGYARREEDCVPKSGPEVNSTPKVNDLDFVSHHKVVVPEVDSENYDEESDDYLVNSYDVTSEILPPLPTVKQCPLHAVNSSDIRRFDNRSVYVISFQRILEPDQFVWQGGTLFVCSSDIPRSDPDGKTHEGDPMFLSPRYNFTMFQFESTQRSLSLVGAIICLVALFIQLLVYAMFTSLWANTDGKCVLCLAVSLFLAQLLYLFIILVWEEFPGPMVCFIVSEAMQYCFLAAFCWLNVVSIDVFRWLKSSDSSSTYSYIAEECCTRFLWYSLYAWSVPLIVVSGSVITVVLRIDGWHPYDGRSGGCWVMGLSQLMLFTLPICLLLAVNIILYVIAACNFCCEAFSARIEHHRNKYKHRCIVSMQLSVLMGMTWLFGVVAVVSEWSFLWYLFVLFDAIQGLFLCVAFVCTKKVWRLFCSKKRIQRLSDGTGRTSANKARSKAGTGRNKLSPISAKNRVIMLETSI